MTTLAVTCPAAAPTRVDRLLLAMSSRLSRMAEDRMLRRARLAGLAALRVEVADRQRDRVGDMRAQILPR